MSLFFKLTTRLWLFILSGSLLVVVGCTSPTATSNPTSEGVNQSQDIYQSLSITPQPDNQLCWYDANFFVDKWDEYIANPVFEDGLATGLILQNGEKIGQETYQIMPNTPIHLTYRGYYHNANDSSATSSVRYVALLDEHQLSSAFDDSDTLYHDMVFNNHQEQTFTITIPPLIEGIHEFIVIGIQQTELFNDGRVGAFVIRLTLIAGNPSLSFDTTDYVSIQPTEYRTNENVNDYWSLSIHSDQSNMVWVYPDIYKTAINQLDFYISTGYMEQTDRLIEHNITPNSQPIALVTLLDYVQVPIQEDKLVFYGLLTPDNSYSYIPASIDVSEYSGKKELLVVQINYPRIPYCILTPPATEPIGFSFYFPINVQRYGVDVQN